MKSNIVNNKKFNIYMCLTIVWILVIFSFSMQSGEESHEVSGGIVSQLIEVLFPQGFMYVEQLEFLIRRTAHFTEYFVLAILVLQMLKQTTCPKLFIVCMFICVLVAGCDETIQLFSGGRSGRITDVMWDSVGAVCGSWMCTNRKK